MKNPENIDWQGHRGARGNFPENTWPAFKYAIDQDMTTLEMDVVITKDRKVVLSHEPFLNYQICKDTAGNQIPENEELKWNIYQLNYEELKRCDCGAIQNPNFPDQQIVKKTPKPLLLDIIQKVKDYCESENKELPHMNVEIKYEEEMKKIFHPDIEEFSNLVYQVLINNYPQDKWNIQSFDFNVLKHFHTTYPNVELAALVYENNNWQSQFEELGFVPDIYSPYFELVDDQLIKDLHEQNVKITPWTVNDEEQMERLLTLGVDGIITDYPELANKFRKNP
ncbi:glycerophosphodiester phosphodiesterase [Marivirga sp. S37H4]|uniref:Glycerophosphodiester phosphodiesterase n=2 Tax=Marivirga aurantiaca TaxID=2802615 RepID=A0A935CDE0_9BACT|nr:glycerophosphodiester phosphodiesterase [Marivirga aurantiaca]